MNITIYSKPNCTFCVQAKNLIKSKNLQYTEIELDFGQTPADGNQLMEVASFKVSHPGVTSMPLIVIDGVRIGGFKELKNHLDKE